MERGLGRLQKSTIETVHLETYAIRDLWKRAKLNQQRRAKLKNAHSPSTTSAGTPETATNFRQCSASVSNSSVLNATENNFSRRRKRFDDIPIKTAITVRAEKDSTSKRNFNALNKKPLVRLPNIYEPRAGLPSYAIRDVAEWESEIRKHVPKRPQMYVLASADSDIRSPSAVEPMISETTRDSGCMFRPTSVPYKGKGKEYMIDPEWPSEIHKSHQRKARLICNWVG